MKTHPMKKVLIALDFDPTAQKVAEVGYALAKTMHAEVTLLHVISDSEYYSLTAYSPIMGFTDDMGTIPPQFGSTDRIKKSTLHFLEQAKDHLGDNSIQTLIKEGDYADSILLTAKQLHAEVIIMGSHSHRWLEEILLGSVTEKVLRLTSTPLFIVPTRKVNGFKADPMLEATIEKDQELIQEILEKE